MKRITKSAILREARRVYGRDVCLFTQPRGAGWDIEVFALQAGVQMLYLRGASSDESRRMALAALQAAGSAR